MSMQLVSRREAYTLKKKKKKKKKKKEKRRVGKKF